MKTKHILLLGLGSLTATAAIATPIALVNSDFGGGGKPTRIVVGNVNNDSATLQIPFSEKISSTKATVTLVYENKEEQVEAEIVNDNDGTKVILTNLKPNTKYQIKQMKFDDKIINFKDSQFATKDNNLEQDVVVQPNEEQLPKTVDKTDENKEESKKSDNQQEDKHEQGQSTKVEEPVVTPGVGTQEPAVSLPQKVESKEADNSAEKQKEEKPKDQPDDSGPLSNISEQNQVRKQEPEVQQEVKKEEKEPEKTEIKETTEPKRGNSNLQDNAQVSEKSNEASETDSASPQTSSPSKGQTEENGINSNDSQTGSEPKIQADQTKESSEITATPGETSGVQSIEGAEGTPAQTLAQTTLPNSDNTHNQTSNTEATINQETSSHTNKSQADTSTTIKVGYWRVNQYSTKNQELTDFIVKIIDELKLNLLVLTGISDGQHNDGQQIVSQLNKNGTELPWKQITGSSTGKSKHKVSFIYDSQFVDLISNSETVKLSTTDQDDYTIPPAFVKFKTKNNKLFSIVSSVLKSNSRKKGKGKGKSKSAPSPTNNPAEKLEKQLSTLIGDNEKNVIFIGDSGISTKNQDTKSPLKDYKFINLVDQNNLKSTDKNDSTIFTKNGADFETEHPSLFDISNHKEKTNVTRNKPTHNPIYVDLKFN